MDYPDFKHSIVLRLRTASAFRYNGAGTVPDERSFGRNAKGRVRGLPNPGLRRGIIQNDPANVKP